MNPPIRGPRHMDAGLARDQRRHGGQHRLRPRAARRGRKKLLPWPDCPAGLTGVQTLVPVMLNHVNAGRLSLERMVDLMCAGPARVYGVRRQRPAGGRLRRRLHPGGHAAPAPIEESWIVSPCGWTPFAGMDITGWPVATIVRGQVVMREDEVLGSPDRPAGALRLEIRPLPRAVRFLLRG